MQVITQDICTPDHYIGFTLLGQCQSRLGVLCVLQAYTHVVDVE